MNDKLAYDNSQTDQNNNLSLLSAVHSHTSADDSNPTDNDHIQKPPQPASQNNTSKNSTTMEADESINMKNSDPETSMSTSDEEVDVEP